MKIDNLKTKTEDILSHHDLVFRAPVCDPMYGLPIGNGSLGCLLWLGEDSLHININHTDLLDDIGSLNYPDEFYRKREDETHSTVRGGAELIFDFGQPIFDTIYQKNFEGRLSLSDACAMISSETPFAKTEISAFASEGSDCAVVSIESETADKILLRARLQRFGSRSFMFWYQRFANDPSIGLDGTISSAMKNAVCISQRLEGVDFCIALLPVSNGEINTRFRGNHGSEVDFAERKSHKIELYIALATADNAEEAEKNAFLKVNQAYRLGKDVIYAQHKQTWCDFWNRSYIVLPDEKDFIENLWYLNLYYGNSEMKGKYPPHFCNGIWGTNHDFVPWNFYFHWNTQHPFYSYNTANHPELIDSYASFRREQLPIAQKYASEFKKTRGAFYSDISDMKGRMVVDHGEMLKNCTCGAQIAMILYRRFSYTGDERFLRETALPVMREVGLCYLDLLKMGDDGFYHIYDTRPYESAITVDDCITDLSMIRALFSALVTVLDEKEAEPFLERLEKLVPYSGVTLDDDEIDNGKIPYGLGRGKAYRGNKVITVGNASAGQNAKTRGTSGEERDIIPGEKMRKTFATLEKNNNSFYGFTDVEYAPVFPSSVVGIKDKGTELYDMLYNNVMMHHPALEDEHDTNVDGICMGYCYVPIHLARLGLCEELWSQLDRTASTWLAYPQGFGIYGTYVTFWGHDMNSWRSTRHRFLKADILNISHEYKDIVLDFKRDFFNDKPQYHSNIPLWKFRHFNYETLPVLATAVNEMLIQSYDGTVRLFCAVMGDKEYSFKLAAEGGFLVGAVYSCGEFNASIESRLGGELNIDFCNVDGEVFFENEKGERINPKKTEKGYAIFTECGMKISAYTENGKNLSLSKNYEKNNDAKHLGSAWLGCKKEF